jgi:hypothetical protein
MVPVIFPEGEERIGTVNRTCEAMMIDVWGLRVLMGRICEGSWEIKYRGRPRGLLTLDLGPWIDHKSPNNLVLHFAEMGSLLGK